MLFIYIYICRRGRDTQREMEGGRAKRGEMDVGWERAVRVILYKGLRTGCS